MNNSISSSSYGVPSAKNKSWNQTSGSADWSHLIGQNHPKTTLVYEYPTLNGDPYYPIPRAENAQLYARYQKLATQNRGVYFAGRLATYKYYNMDQVVAQALTLYDKIQGIERTKAITEPTLHYLPVNTPVPNRKW